MNKVCLIGRLTAQPELRYNNGNVAYTRFTLAVNRNFTSQNGERETDFINCVAWRKTAELICEHLNKGSQIGIEGRIQTGSYDDKDGNKRFTTDVIVENLTFVDSKKSERPEPEYEEPQQQESDPFADFGEQISVEDNFLD
ncbi:MAG: single-stranded DNA-binding protein [Bacilli bacterium]